MKNKIKQLLNKFVDSLKLSGIGIIVAILGAFAGSHGTSLLWRRCGIPLVFTILALIELKNLWVIFLMSFWGWFSIGYGIPDATDDGSMLGKFYYNLFKQNHFLADIFTRGTVGLGMSLSFLVIPILKGNWLFYFLGSLGIILSQAFISWQGLGNVELKWKNKSYSLCKSDFLNYLIIGFCGSLIIFKG